MKSKVVYKTTNKLLIIVAFVISLISFSFFSFFITSRKITELSSFINNAGIIRGSIQRFSTCFLLGFDITKPKEEIYANIQKLNEYCEANKSLFDAEDQETLENLYIAWSEYSTQIDTMPINIIQETNEKLWGLTNKTVKIIEYKTHKSIRRLLFFNGFTLAGLVLLFVVIWILKTTVQFQIENQAAFDSLTKLFNRNYLPQLYKEIQTKAKTEKKQIAFLICDIDHFKRVNDNYGHQVGDEVLKTIAKILIEKSRDTDFIIRYGGEEFLILSLFEEHRGLLQYAERLRTSVEEAKIIQDPITISIGVHPLYSKMQLNQAIIYADEALYKAKDSGRNKVVVSTKE